MLHIVADLDFGKDAPGRESLREGWGEQHDNFVRSVGHRSVIALDRPAGSRIPGSWLLELELRPFLIKDVLPFQVLTIVADGVVIAQDKVAVFERMTVGYPIEIAPGSEPINLEFRFPKAASPADFGKAGRMTLAFDVFRLRLVRQPVRAPVAVRRYPPCVPAGAVADHTMTPDLETIIGDTMGLSPEGFALRFESLGRDCEFGLVQRALGAAPLGLLRFNNVSLQALLGGIECAFADADDPALMFIKRSNLPNDEFFVAHKRYGFSMHTDRLVESTTAEAVMHDMTRSIGYLKLKFRQTLLEGDRIFVCKPWEQTLIAQMRPLLVRLQAYGPNRVLFVTKDAHRRPGVVDDYGDGLMHGAIDRFSPPGQIDRFNLPAWVSLCINALRAQGATG